MTQTAPQLLSSAEVCTALSIDRSTLSRWVASGRLTPAYKLPGRTGAFLFAPDDVERVRLALATLSGGSAAS